MSLDALIESGVGLPQTVALAAVAVIGYVFGRRNRTEPTGLTDEAARAAEIARQLEAVAASLRSDLAVHRHQVEQFKREIDRNSASAGDDTLQRLQEEADRVLEPTLRLVSQVASAYDRIRQQSQALAKFSGGRTDSLTGLCNSRALSELLQVELAGSDAMGGQLSIAIFGLQSDEDPTDEGRAEKQSRLLLATELLLPQLRDADALARFGIDELVVVMPHTRLYGASVFGRRARAVLSNAGVSINCGLAQGAPGETAASLLGRADSALYSARTKGPNTQFLHNGQAIREDKPTSPTPEQAAEPAALEPAAG